MARTSRLALILLIAFIAITLQTSPVSAFRHTRRNSTTSTTVTNTIANMATPAQRLADLKAPYPEPRPDQRRYVIFLEPKGDHVELNDYKVELMPGRMENVDGANLHRVGGKVEEKTIQGWGYNYFEVTMMHTASTLMMPLGPAAELKPRFVRMYVDQLYRYNSKLPIVVLMPKDSELRYRIWTATGATEGVPAPEL